MKKFMLLGLLLLGAHSASAAYLCWQVNYNESSPEAAHRDTAGSGVGVFNAARLVAVKGNERQILGEIDEYGDSYEGWYPTWDEERVCSEYGTTGALYADVTGYTEGWSFYIELGYYEDDNVVKKGGTTVGMTYSALTDLNKGHTSDNFLDLESGELPYVAWHGEGYAIPEPTGGVLMLMGLGLLALKRKRAEKVA